MNKEGVLKGLVQSSIEAIKLSYITGFLELLIVH